MSIALIVSLISKCYIQLDTLYLMCILHWSCMKEIFPRKKYERKLKGKWCSKKKKKMLQYKTSDHMNQSVTSRKVCHRKLDNYIALSRYIYIGAALRKP
jgi:hypothetical protein